MNVLQRKPLEQIYITGMLNGYITYLGEDYIFTKEDCYMLAANVNKEETDEIIEDLNKRGINFKYETNAEAFKDPRMKNFKVIK